jgi:hypothetical protein
MKRAIICLGLLGLLGGATAAEQPFQASLTPDIALYPKTEPIAGLTLSIWGENPQHSLALGFVNGSSGKSGGASLGLFNYGEGYIGVQWSFVNYDTGDFLGWQNGAVNFTKGRVTGLQSGCVNYAGTLSGLQLGIVNIAEKGDSAVQIGLVNIIRENQLWFQEFPRNLAPGMIIANWRF